MSYYESNSGVVEYVLAHYAPDKLVLPYPFGPTGALQFQSRVVTDCIDKTLLTDRSRALDLGCAVGRTSFELSRLVGDVLGIDRSEQFVAVADKMRREKYLEIEYPISGAETQRARFELPKGSFPDHVRFQCGDATVIQDSWGMFDVVMLVNVIDRLPDPAACLSSVHRIMNMGAQLIITSPYTWMESYTPKDKWLAGIDGIQKVLNSQFILKSTQDIPFIIREHARKYQWVVAQASTWIKR